MSAIFKIKHGVVLPPPQFGPVSLYNFIPGILEDHYNRIMKAFDELANYDNESDYILNDKAQTIWELLDCQDIHDLGTHEFENWSFTNNFRVTKDLEGNVKSSKTVRKTKIEKINYYNQGNDFRISIDTEKFEPASEDSIPDDSKVMIKRLKNGRSFSCEFLQFDFNQILEKSKKTEGETKYEIEIEITDVEGM
eukprot:CAMPEP_0205810774 /NCGR_PEP_ID=MMETSP0205-20121125/14935_1 /ASSEMBLY_ACC=CAM_ASM_000278 /TAXON_ID=36767 /ORGANISM="Euplotes focardii, Strain TN1" /LENGTH=193 /DNA_ID=CAMNT_0053089203 /DNA_START=91 /DNA_END=669 /DNA_ORIENTATION=+